MAIHTSKCWCVWHHCKDGPQVEVMEKNHWRCGETRNHPKNATFFEGVQHACLNSHCSKTRFFINPNGNEVPKDITMIQTCGKYQCFHQHEHHNEHENWWKRWADFRADFRDVFAGGVPPSHRRFHRASPRPAPAAPPVRSASRRKQRGTGAGLRSPAGMSKGQLRDVKNY